MVRSIEEWFEVLQRGEALNEWCEALNEWCGASNEWCEALGWLCPW
jgi:hypothetical protein